jgi:phosphate-selective porin
LRSKSDYPWEVFTTVDYQEKRTREDETFQLYDLRLRLPIGAMYLDIGKQKQPFSYEIASLSIVNPQQERILSPFFVTRSIGIKASGQMAGDRMTWAAGWFNDWLESDATFSHNANDYVGRITGLVSVSPDNLDYLHIGIGARRSGPDSDFFQLSGRPESNVADRYVDTGEFTGDFIAEVGVEILWDRGPFLIAAEHIEARTKSAETGDPRMTGDYLMASWVVTGESRPYLRQVGATGPITPTSRHGALELVVRYSRLDLTDSVIDGGVLEKWHYGVNWWLSPQWKAGVSYGDADLVRDNLDGNTKMSLFRLQWYY